MENREDEVFALLAPPENVYLCKATDRGWELERGVIAETAQAWLALYQEKYPGIRFDIRTTCPDPQCTFKER